MSYFKEKHKEYLVKNGIKTEDDLVIYLDILRNTRNSPKEDRRMLMDFAWLLVNDKTSVLSFFAETKSLQNKNPSKEFYNAFKQTTSSPTFMDEVIDSNTTVTEAPNFNESVGFQMKRGKPISYRPAQQGGEKETEGKLNYELDWEFIQQLAERMSQNKGKYKPYNWMQPIDVEKLKQSLFRHVVEVMKGNYEDDGRTFGHLESISANVMMINYQLKNKS